MAYRNTFLLGEQKYYPTQITRLKVILLLLFMSSNCISQDKIESEVILIQPGFGNGIDIKIKKEAQLILFGEVHNVPINQILKFQLLNHTHANNHVRYLIVEAGPATSYILNRYLETGEKSLLTLMSYFENELSFWQQLRSFNQTMTPDNKIQVLGFDFDLIKPLIFSLNELLQTKIKYRAETNYIIKNLLSKINSDQNINMSSIKSDLRLLLSSTDDSLNQDISANRLTLEQIAWNKVPYTGSLKRDKEIYKNINQFISNYRNGNFFGQFGISHVNKDLPSLAKFLDKNHDSPFKDKVISISPHYMNCETIWENDIKKLSSFGILKGTHIKYSDLDKIKANVSIIETSKFIHKKKIMKSTDFILIIKNQFVNQVPTINE